METTSIIVDGHVLQVELARSPAEHMRGLMDRRELTWNNGMLFVYPTAYRVSMWMKNTYLPLSVAFINDSRQIVHISDMQPQTTKIHRSPVTVRYALEVNQGWFKKNKVHPGGLMRFSITVSK